MYFLNDLNYDNVKYREHIPTIHDNLYRSFLLNISSIANYYKDSITYINNTNPLYKLIRLIDIHTIDEDTPNALVMNLSMDLKIDSKFRNVATVDIDKPYILLDTTSTKVIKVISVDESNYREHLSLIHPTKLNISDMCVVINPIKLQKDREKKGLGYLEYLYKVIYMEMIKQSFIISLIYSSLKGIKFKPIKEITPYVLLDISGYVNKYINYIYDDLDYTLNHIELLKRYKFGNLDFLYYLCSDTELKTVSQYVSFIYIHTNIIEYLLWNYDSSVNNTYLADLRDIIKQANIVYGKGIYYNKVNKIANIPTLNY